MSKARTIIEKIEDDLRWRSPQLNMPLGHIVLSRDQAEQLLQEIAELRGKIGKYER